MRFNCFNEIDCCLVPLKSARDGYTITPLMEAPKIQRTNHLTKFSRFLTIIVDSQPQGGSMKRRYFWARRRDVKIAFILLKLTHFEGFYWRLEKMFVNNKNFLMKNLVKIIWYHLKLRRYQYQSLKEQITFSYQHSLHLHHFEFYLFYFHFLKISSNEWNIYELSQCSVWMYKWLNSTADQVVDCWLNNVFGFTRDKKSQ